MQMNNNHTRDRKGPLADINVIEFGGIGPGPLCAMLLSDAGANVLRLDRQSPSGLGLKREAQYDVQRRGRKSVAIDLKNPVAREAVLKLVEKADAVLDPFRPGVLEKLGLGPDVLLAHNPKIVLTRITGWGQSGPLAKSAGHDINYLSITGVLAAIGPKNGRPCPPLNLVADMGAGAMFSAFGTLAAIIDARKSGKGQVVDSAMCDGSAYLASGMFGWCAEGTYDFQRESNMLDGGAPFYGTYETLDGHYMAIGCLEKKFFDMAMDKLNIDAGQWGNHLDKNDWFQMTEQITAAFLGKTRSEWCEIFEGTDACVSPVLNFKEACSHHHNVARGNLPESDGFNQPAPAPVFANTPGAIQCAPPEFGAHTESALAEWGFSKDEIADLSRQNAIGLQ